MFAYFRRYHFFSIDSSSMDFWHVQVLQLLDVCDQNVALPDSRRVQCISEEYSEKNFSKFVGSRQVLWQRYDDILLSNHWESSVLRMVRRITVHQVFHRPIRSLERSEESKSIPWNLSTTSSKPDCNKTILQKFVPCFCVPFFQQNHSFQIEEVLTYNDYMMILHKIRQIFKTCQYKMTLVSLTGRHFPKFSFRLLWVFFFLRGYACIHVYRWFFEIHNTHWKFCHLLLSRTQNFLLEVKLYQCASWKVTS